MQSGFRANHTAGNFLPGISGWLGGEIVRMRMNNDRPAKHFLNGKTIRHKNRNSLSATAKQGWQVSGVAGMELVFGIIVDQCIGKGIRFISCAGAAFVDVKAKEASLCFRQAADICQDHYALFCIIKPHGSTKGWILPAAMEPCDGSRFLAEYQGAVIQPAGHLHDYHLPFQITTIYAPSNDLLRRKF